MNYGHGYDIGPEKVNTQQYERTLYTKDCATSATWQLDHKYTGFRASVGLSDTSGSSNKVTFSVLVDGETKAVYPVSVGALQSLPLVNLHDAFRVTLKAQSESLCALGFFDGKAVWINPVIS